MKKIIFLGLVISSVFAFGQEVKLRKGIVSIDGKECFKYTSDLLANNTVFKTNDGQTMFFMDVLDGSSKKTIKMYNKISVIGSDRIVTMDGGIARKDVIQGMILTNVINSSDCTFNKDNFGDFANRYDQHIESSIIRVLD